MDSPQKLYDSIKNETGFGNDDVCNCIKFPRTPIANIKMDNDNLPLIVDNLSKNSEIFQKFIYEWFSRPQLHYGKCKSKPKIPLSFIPKNYGWKINEKGEKYNPSGLSIIEWEMHDYLIKMYFAPYYKY